MIRAVRVRLALALVIAAACAASAARAEVLVPREAVDAVTLRTGSKARAYVPLARDGQLHYAFCGQGTLQILSRALLDADADAARYVLRASIDGARPPQEQRHRAAAVAEASFSGGGLRGAVRPTPRRRTTLALARGCHTVVLSLPRSSAARVAVRVLWDVEPATRRAWTPVETARGGQAVQLTVGAGRAAYRHLAAGETFAIDVDGPAWVRVLARPIGQRAAMRYALAVAEAGRALRRYQLDGAPSRRARLADGTAVCAANEVVFAVGPGRHQLRFRTGDALPIALRAETATIDAAAEAAGAPWRLRARLASYYDDNILRYSQRFIDRFDRGQDPRRFRVESLDDVIQRVDLGLEREIAGWDRRPARVGVDVEHRAYARNDIKDWTRVAATFAQDLGLDRRLTARASWAPDFYVRHLRDSDLTGGTGGTDPFQAFAFDKGEVRLSYRHAPRRPLRFTYHLGWATLRHTDAFREFDSDNLFAGVRLDQRVGRGWRLSYAVEHTESDARGFDEPGETRATSDDTDPTYRQTDLMLAVRYRFDGPRRMTLFLQGEIGLRTYTTDKPERLAPLHAGREDDLLRLYASWQIDLTRRYGLTVFAQLRDRSSSAPIRIDIGVEKDYAQYEIGARLSARFGR
ncbi:MAG: hypothetical protein AAF772_07965 [Acidobacteriota bacterium]